MTPATTVALWLLAIIIYCLGSVWLARRLGDRADDFPPLPEPWE